MTAAAARRKDADARPKPEGPRKSVTPMEAATDARLTRNDCRVLMALGRHTDRNGWCVRKQGPLAADLGLSRRSVIRIVQRLERFGYLIVDQRRADNGGKLACGYRLCSPIVDVAVSDPAIDGTHVTPESHGGCDTLGVTRDVTPESHINNDFSERKNTLPRTRARVPPAAVLLGRVGPPVKSGGGGSRRRPTAADGQRELLPAIAVMPRGTRIPEDWQPGEADRDFAVEHGLAPAEVYREAVKFVAWWRQKSGPMALSADWSQSWRIWVLRSAERKSERKESGDGGKASGTGRGGDSRRGRGGTVEKGMRDGFAALRARPVGEDR